MNIYIYWIAGVFVISAVCGFVFIPLILNFCKSRNLYDVPNARKVHKNAVPRLGGISFIPSMFIAMATALAAINHTHEQITIGLWSFYFMISILLIYFMGIIDDIIGLPPSAKFVVQTVSACLLPMVGLYINNLYGLFGIHEIPYYLGFPLTVLVVVFIDNAINLIDGIDGLAASLSIIALLGFLYIFATHGAWIYSLLIAGLIGVLTAFLYFNLFGSATANRKIFMGDSGSLTLGFILGFLCVKYSMKTDINLTPRHYDFIMAYTLVIIPMFDTVRVSLVRICHGQSPFRADKRHIHHKLMRAGLSQHGTLVCIVTAAVAYIAGNWALLKVTCNTNVLIFDILVYVIMNLVLNGCIRHRRASARP